MNKKVLHAAVAAICALVWELDTAVLNRFFIFAILRTQNTSVPTEYTAPPKNGLITYFGNGLITLLMASDQPILF